MSNAKAIGQAARDGAANPRHNLELLGALLVGANIADAEQIASIMALLESVGFSSDLQLVVGALALVVARGLSWLKRSRATQGDVK